MPDLNTKQAVVLMVLSATIISTSGLVVRLLDQANDWQVVFWRGLSLALGVATIILWQHRRRAVQEFKQIGTLGVLGGVFLSGALIGYVVSIANTTVANAVFTMSSAPFVTAIFAWIVLGERISRATVLSIFVAMSGVGLMVSDGISSGNAFGNAMALFAVVSASSFMVVLRKGKSINMLPTLSVGAGVSALVAAIMVGGNITVSLFDLVLCLILGGVIATSGQAMMVAASRVLTGAELALLTLIEFILAPVWVWAFVHEVPSQMTLIGGAVVLLAVGGHAVRGMKAQRT